METILPAIGVANLEESVQKAGHGELVAVTLTNGHLLLGGISEAPVREAREILIGFNTEDGRRYGSSYLVVVPVDLVADVEVIPLDDESTPRPADDDPAVAGLRLILGQELLDSLDLRIAPRDYANPLASIICEHNLSVASSNGLRVEGYVERALSQEAVPQDGVRFDSDVLLYVDWDFFLREAAGGIAVSAGIPGVVEVEKQAGQSLQSQVLQRLRGSVKRRIADEVRRRASPTMGEQVVHGILDVPESGQTTELEGDECELLVARDPDSGESSPVLVKVGSLSYPREFLPLVRSKLAIYGETRPIPVRVLGADYESVLLARAIAYLHEPK